MKEYNYFQAMFMSLYSRNLYRDVVKNWGAGIVLYLFLLLLICWIVVIFKIQPTINYTFTQIANKYSSQVPEVVVKNGIVKTPDNKPYLIKDPDNGQVVAVIDTSGQYNTLQNAPEKTQLLLTKTMFYHLDNSNNVRVQNIPTNVNVDLKPGEIKTFALKLIGWLWVLILPFALIISFIYRLVQALIYGIIGKIFAAMADVNLVYSEILKISMIAVTPAILLDTVLTLFGATFHYQLLVYFVITMVYLVFGIRANRKI